MGIYIALMCYIVFMFLLDHNRCRGNREKRSVNLLRLVFVAIYLLCALKASSVGRDIPGYARLYEVTKSIPFGNFNYVYYENGYILLMKICTLLRMDVQLFFAVAYFLVVYPIYLFIKEFSEEKILSSLIYVCYMIFEFDLTGLRQAIAMSILLLGFISIAKNRKHKYIEFLLAVAVAATFHKSALLALVLIPLLQIRDLRIYTATMIVGLAASLLLRSKLMLFVKNLFGKETFQAGASLYIGANLFFLCVLAAFVVYVHVTSTKKDRESTLSYGYETSGNNIFTRIFLLGIVVAFFFGSETSARSFMYFSQVIMVLLPNTIRKLDARSRRFVSIVFIAFFCVFFYTNSLSGGGFDIVPYRFFWE